MKKPRGIPGFKATFFTLYIVIKPHEQSLKIIRHQEIMGISNLLYSNGLDYFYDITPQLIMGNKRLLLIHEFLRHKPRLVKLPF